MSKTVIIYKTKYNTTKKYAGWLAIKIDADLYEISDIRNNDLKKYDTIIFGGAIENGYIKGIEFIKDNMEKIKDKQIIVFYVGLGIYTLDEIMAFNFLPTYRYKNIKFFELMGDFDYKNLSFIDKLRVKFGSGKITSDLIDLNKNIKNAKKENIKPILRFLESNKV